VSNYEAVQEYFADLAAVVRDADPTDKAEIYRGLDLVLTYQPAAQTVRAQAHLAGDPHGVMVRLRGGTRPLRTCLRSRVSWSSGPVTYG
jgi:hypothetical protein